MKLIKEIIYQEHQSEKRIGQVDDLVYSIRRTDDEFDLYFEIRETEDYVIFANLGGYERSEEEKAGNEERAVQIETAVLDKATNKIYWLGDNTGLDSYNRLAAYPYWTREDLCQVGVESFGEAPWGKFDHTHEWDY